MSLKNWREIFSNLNDVDINTAALVSRVIKYYPLPENCNTEQSDNSNTLLFGILLKVHTALLKGHTCLNLLHIANTRIFSEIEKSLEPTHVLHEFEQLNEALKSSYQNSNGSVLDVAHQVLDEELKGEKSKGIQMPDINTIHSLLKTWIDNQSVSPPYVLHKHYLAIKRYYDYEQFISKKVQSITTRLNVDIELEHRELFNQLFDKQSRKSKQAQAVACALAQQFVILNGGPGTGKTYTVARMLIMLKSKYPRLQISMAAPTGKAAHRLSESLLQTLENVGNSEQLKQICRTLPTKAHTIHSLLGTEKGSAAVRRNSSNPLPCDLLVVDEFSMVDSALFAKVLDACKPSCRLILVGDSQQLPSVEPGNVLHDLVDGSKDVKSIEMSNFIADLTGTHARVEGNSQYDHIVTLAENHRSVESINDIATAVIEKRVDDAIRKVSELNILPDKIDVEDYLAHQHKLLQQFTDEYLEILNKAKTVQELFDLFSSFRILCPIRKGLHGVEAINQWFAQKVLLSNRQSGNSSFFHGQPIIITENDPSTGLSNGDFGIIWQDGDDNEQLIAHIERDNLAISASAKQSSQLKLSVNRLPNFETAFALTIHKTQGSEFARVLLVLPYELAQGCTRELLYTGITRAKSKINVFARECVLRASIELSNKRITVLNAT